MTTSAIRRRAALDAIARVVAGAVAKDVENQLVDFKEEAGTISPGGGRRIIDPRHLAAAEALANEVACMANSRTGGVLVVGVEDDASGAAALRGSHLALDWLRERIWALTSPRYNVEVEELLEQGIRLYLIDVPPALEEIRAGGRLRIRRGTDCQEVTGDDARRLLEERRGFDWTAQPSGLRLSDAEPEAFRAARRFYAERRGEPPAGDRELARRMGVLLDESGDPELSRAGALLLAPFEPAVHQLQVLVTDTEGAPSREHLLEPAPLLPLLLDVFTILDTVAFPAHPRIIGLTRRELRNVPQLAYREALVNAVMHRDYQLDRRVIIALATGSPSDAFKVRSPGGFPSSVSPDRLLATGSHPRNEALARALRVLAVAEREGVGINSMYRSMLRDGHEPPEIIEDAGDVVVRLPGGAPNLAIRAFFDDMEGLDESLSHSAAATFAIDHLLEKTPLRPDMLASLAQRTVSESIEVLERLERVGLLERLLNRSLSFRLTPTSQERLGAAVRYRRSSMDEHWNLIRAYLDDHEEIRREEVSRLLQVTPLRATHILTSLRKDGRLEHIGGSRGRAVRYRAV